MRLQSIFQMKPASGLVWVIAATALAASAPAEAQTKHRVDPDSETGLACRQAVKERVREMDSRAEQVHVDLEQALEWQENEVEKFIAGQGRFERRSGNWREYRYQCIFYLRTGTVTVVEVSMGADSDYREETGAFGVTLYRDLSFGGVSETFAEDVRDLRGSRIGDDQTTSVRVSRGCRALLYRDLDFQGAYTEVTADSADLRGSRVGDDSVTSMQVRCSGDDWDQKGVDWDEDPWSQGVTLYRDLNFSGVSETFDRDNPDLRGSRIGDDQTTSVRVGHGCRARLYQDTNFRGRYTEVSSEIPDLRRSEVGDDSITSIQVRCDR